MPSYDISKVAFDPRKHYSSVRMQQGRVLTDDDWNENERIDGEERRRSRVDIIGPFGSPDNGFRISNLSTMGDGSFTFDIDAGTLHLGGHRLELDGAETYQTQRDWLRQTPTDRTTPSPADIAAGAERFDLVYVEAWQQPVSAVEDEALLEAALGGPDTTTRLRTTRRVAVQLNIGSDDCPEAWQRLGQLWTSKQLGTLTPRHERIPNVTLTVAFTGAVAPNDLCTPAIAGGYLGAENQAIRVELTDADHFTWGFDNAAPIYRARVSASANGLDTITLLSQPNDQYHWPLAGQIVEVLPWAELLANGRKTADRRGHFSRVSQSYNPDSQQFALATPVTVGFGGEWKTRPDAPAIVAPAPGDFVYVRVWQRGDDVASPSQIALVPGTPVALGNTGLSVTFTGPDRVANDHWVIAVRPETPSQLVPWELATGLPPMGVRRFFAPLGIIRWANVGGVIEGKVIHDCRRKFRPLTDADCCCTYSVGDGVVSHGDYNSIQEAIDNLPANGGKICVLPGLHHAHALIRNRRQIHISGCGDQTIVWDAVERGSRAIFTIAHSQRITIERLTLVTLDGVAVLVRDPDKQGRPSEQITIQYNRILACIHAVYVRLNEQRAGNNQILIERNQIGMLDKPTGRAAIFVLADEVLIERNRIVLVPATRPDDPNDPRPPTDPGDPFDPCFDPRKLIGKRAKQYAFVNTTFLYIGQYMVGVSKAPMYQAQGGIQVGGSSEMVQIRRNDIIGGWGNGITLGHVPGQQQEFDPRQYMYGSLNEAAAQAFLSTIYDLTIAENRIQQMGLSGVGVVAFFDKKEVALAVRVHEFLIAQNVIAHCALQPPVDIPDNFRDDIAVGGIILVHAKNGQIRGNRIEQNGLTAMLPVCGVFVAFGEKIGLSDNHILNNGPWVERDQQALQRGNRGGIVIESAIKLADAIKASRPSDDALPAVWIHDNVVTQPLGHALLVIAIGPVSVTDNYLTSLGTDTTNLFSKLASSVFILDLGLSKDLILLLLKAVSANQNQAAWTKLLDSPQGQQLIRAVQYLPSGKVLFSGNQTTLDMRADTRTVTISSQLIASLDDIAFLGNQSECEALLMTAVPNPTTGGGGGLTFDVVVVNTILAAATVRANDNRFTDGLTATIYSLVSFGLLNTATGNQATHCLHVLGSRVVENSNLVLFNDNCNQDKAQLGQMLAARPF